MPEGGYFIVFLTYRVERACYMRCTSKQRIDVKNKTPKIRQKQTKSKFDVS